MDKAFVQSATILVESSFLLFPAKVNAAVFRVLSLHVVILCFCISGPPYLKDLSMEPYFKCLYFIFTLFQFGHLAFPALTYNTYQLERVERNVFMNCCSAFYALPHTRAHKHPGLVRVTGIDMNECLAAPNLALLTSGKRHFCGIVGIRPCHLLTIIRTLFQSPYIESLRLCSDTQFKPPLCSEFALECNWKKSCKK